MHVCAAKAVYKPCNDIRVNNYLTEKWVIDNNCLTGSRNKMLSVVLWTINTPVRNIPHDARIIPVRNI